MIDIDDMKKLAGSRKGEPARVHPIRFGRRYRRGGRGDDVRRGGGGDAEARRLGPLRPCPWRHHRYPRSGRLSRYRDPGALLGRHVQQPHRGRRQGQHHRRSRRKHGARRRRQDLGLQAPEGRDLPQRQELHGRRRHRLLPLPHGPEFQIRGQIPAAGSDGHQGRWAGHGRLLPDRRQCRLPLYLQRLSHPDPAGEAGRDGGLAVGQPHRRLRLRILAARRAGQAEAQHQLSQIGQAAISTR